MSIVRRAWHFLGRMGVASVVLLVLLLFSLLGSLLPQLPAPVSADPQRLSAWLDGARGRYGGAVDALSRWGVFALFRSPLYIVLLALLVLCSLACTLGRWRAPWRLAFDRTPRRSDAFFAGPRSITLPPVTPADLRGALGRRGYRVRATPEEGATHLRADRYGLSGLATLLTHLAVVLLLIGYALTGWLGWRVEVDVGPAEMVEVGHGTGLLVRNDGLTVDHYPQGSVADYRAEVALLEGNRVVQQGTVRVNGPLRFRGLGVFLVGFRPGEGGASLALQVARDPGAPVALVGGLLLLAGGTAAIYLPHRRVYARLEQTRTLVAVRSSGRDDDPHAELKALAQELGEC